MAEDPASRFGKPFHVSRFTRSNLRAHEIHAISRHNAKHETRNGLQISRITGMISGRRDVFFAI